MNALTLRQIKTPLEFESRPALVPSSKEVIVQLKAASLNRRDYWITQGMYPGIELPVVLGSDGAGVVSHCGEEVNSDWMGQEVIINPGFDWGESEESQSGSFNILGLPRDGTFATEVAVPATQLFEKPSHLTWQESAALPLAGVTAYRAVFSQGALKAGDNVLISGIGGGVATLALQYAVAVGAKVWVTSSSKSKIQSAVDLGAQAGMNYNAEGWWKELPKQAAPNLIIDSAGGDGYAAHVSLAAPGGRIVNYGATTGPPEKLDMFKLFWKQLSLRGSTMGSPLDFAQMLEFVKKHQLKPIVDRTFSLENANDALAVMQTSSQFGKLVLEIDCQEC